MCDVLCCVVLCCVVLCVCVCVCVCVRVCVCVCSGLLSILPGYYVEAYTMLAAVVSVCRSGE